MRIERELVITLRSVPYEERSRILTGLSERFGRVSAMARNSVQSRRFGDSLDLFTAANWEIAWKEEADLHRLDKAETQRAFPKLAKDYGKFTLACAFGELALRLSHPDQPAPELFRLLSNALVALEELPEYDPRILTAFFSKSLQLAGSSPGFLTCSGCGKELVSLQPTDEVSLSLERGFFTCPDCMSGAAPGEFVKVAVVYDFMKAQELPIRKFIEHALGSRADHRAFQGILERFAAFHVPGFDRTPLQSFKMIE